MSVVASNRRSMPRCVGRMTAPVGRSVDVRDSRHCPSYRDGVRRPLAALFVVVALGAACAEPEEEALPPVPPIVSTTTTTLVDYSTVPLAAVETKTTTTVNEGPGRARLQGTVVGPEGPVPE